MQVAIFLALLGAHVLGIFYLVSLRGTAADSPDDGFSTSVYFLDDKAQRRSTQTPKSPARAPFALTPPDTRSLRPLAPDTSALSDQEPSAPVAIDWAKEAERVAADPGLNVQAEPTPVAHQQFAWDYAHTHRVESLPDGGLLVNLSDRCSLIIRLPMLLGGCKIGRIESRADLFAHMGE